MTTAPVVDKVSADYKRVLALNSVRVGTKNCGFCNNDRHESCPGGLRQGRTGVWVCPCSDCKPAPRCLNCKNTRHEELDLNTWSCLNRTECQLAIRSRLEQDPLYQQLKQIREKTEMAKVTAEKPARTAAAPKVGKCLVTGKPTKGGLFLPGMDARYVSQTVKAVMEKELTLTQARKQLKDDGVSEKLVAKFEKSLGLAKAAAEKQAEAAKEKAAAKKAAPAKKAAKKTAAKPDPEDDPDDDNGFPDDDE